MTLHLHPEFVPGCYRCDLSRHEAETITCDECGAEIATPLLRDTVEHHATQEAR